MKGGDDHTLHLSGYYQPGPLEEMDDNYDDMLDEDYEDDSCAGVQDNSATNPIQSVMLESDDARKEQPTDNTNFPRIDLEEENGSEDEIASEDEGSEYLREK